MRASEVLKTWSDAARQASAEARAQHREDQGDKRGPGRVSRAGQLYGNAMAYAIKQHGSGWGADHVKAMIDYLGKNGGDPKDIASLQRSLVTKTFDETKHPRAHGRFASTGSGIGGGEVTSDQATHFEAHINATSAASKAGRPGSAAYKQAYSQAYAHHVARITGRQAAQAAAATAGGYAGEVLGGAAATYLTGGLGTAGGLVAGKSIGGALGGFVGSQFGGQVYNRVVKSQDFEVTAEICKTDDSLRTVWGWASIANEGGQPVIDLQGDIISAHELVKAAHEFMENSRDAGEMHRKFGIGTVVESMVLTSELQKSLGIDLGREGWLIGMKVHDDDVWAKVKSGDYAAFSIGGAGVRTPVEG